MSESPLSFSQMAEHVKSQGGGSFSFATGQPAEGPGLMTAYEGGEKTVKSATPKVLSKYYKKKRPGVDLGQDPYLGAWGNKPSILDVSRKIKDVEEAKQFGTEQKQEAAFALPGTVVHAGKTAEEMSGKPWGADVLFHSQPAGQTVDPTGEYTSRKGEFSKNQVENPEWDEVVASQGGKPVTRGDMLRAENKRRTEQLRTLPEEELKKRRWYQEHMERLGKQ